MEYFYIFYIQLPYRWPDWAGNGLVKKGPELLTNNLMT